MLSSAPSTLQRDATGGSMALGSTAGRCLPIAHVHATVCRYCHGGSLALDACYFVPVSSCSLLDVYGPEVAAEWGRHLDTHKLHEARKHLHGERFYFNAVTGQYEFGRIPPQVC